MNGRGQQVELVNDSKLVLNDGSPTRMDDNTGTLSFIDLSRVFSTISA